MTEAAPQLQTIPQGDGSYVVRLSKSGRAALTANQLALYFEVDRESVYRWKNDGTIPARFIRRTGKTRYVFIPGIVGFLKRKFRALHQ
jgi:hypothetical protein